MCNVLYTLVLVKYFSLSTIPNTNKSITYKKGTAHIAAPSLFLLIKGEELDDFRIHF